MTNIQDHINTREVRKNILEALAKKGIPEDKLILVQHILTSPNNKRGRPLDILKRHLIMDHFLVIGSLPCKRPKGSKGRLKKDDPDSGAIINCAREIDRKVKAYFQEFGEARKKFPSKNTHSLVAKLVANNEFRDEFNYKLQSYKNIATDSELANMFIRAML